MAQLVPFPHHLGAAFAFLLLGPLGVCCLHTTKLTDPTIFPPWNWGRKELPCICCMKRKAVLKDHHHPNNSVWKLLHNWEVTRSNQSCFPAQHTPGQPVNTTDSIKRDCLIPDKNSLGSPKASAVLKPQIPLFWTLTILCESQVNLKVVWSTTQVFSVHILSSLSKRPPGPNSRNKAGQENNYDVSLHQVFMQFSLQFFPWRIP